MSALFRKSATPGIVKKILSDPNENSVGGRPSVCRNCGAIVGAGETVCPQCGASLSATPVKVNVPQPPVYDRETMRFARAVLNRPHTFTLLFLVANLFIYLLMWGSSGLQSSALMVFPQPVLTAYGAKLNYLINPGGEWWRFVTPIFIHVNLPHILVNMWSLWAVGPYVEKLYGSAKFVFFWVLTGVAGVVASYLTVRPDMRVNSVGRFIFKTMDTPSAGASGALFGLVGVLFVFGIKFRRELPEGFKRAFGTGLLPMILMNLFIGYMGRGFIDNAAHLGGFFAGALAALFVGYKRPGQRASVAVFWHVLQVTALLLVAVSFVMVVRHFPDVQAEVERQRVAEEKVRAQAQLSNQVKAYVEAMNKGQDALLAALDVEKPNGAGIDEAVKALSDAPRLDEQAGALLDEMKALLERARGLQPVKAGNKAGTNELKKLIADYEKWKENRDRWINENGNKYGIELADKDDSGADKK